jgi:ABC-type spermidine/putrescine transport system permease subunit II
VRRAGRIAAGLFAGAILLFLLAPVAVLVPMSLGSAEIAEFPPRTLSLEQYRRFLDSRPWRDAVGTSVRVALATTVAATTLGTMAAFGLARGGFRGRAVLSALLIAPRFVPVIITALAFYALFARLRLVGSEWGLILAHTILACPYVVIIVSAALRGVDRSLEQASQTLGASPLRTVLSITLPLIRPGLVSAAVVAFITSFDEIVVAIFISGTRAATLPKKMWDSLVFEMEPTLPAISTLVLLTTLAVFAAAAWTRRAAARLRAIGPAGTEPGQR